MGMWSWIKKKSLSAGAFAPVYPVISVSRDIIDLLKGGKAGSLEEAMFNSENVFPVVRVILDKAKPCPWRLYEVKNQQKGDLDYYLSYRNKSEHFTKERQLKEKALKEVEDNPILDLLNKPNNYQTRSQFIEDVLGFYNTLGECFIYADIPVRGRNAGKPTALYSLPAHLVEPIYSNDYRNPIKHYQFSFDGNPIDIDPSRILHIKKWNPLYNYNGGGLHAIAPVQVARDLINRGKANQTAQTKAFINGGSAFLMSSETPNDTFDGMTQEQLDILNDRIKERIQGVENYGTITATNAPVKVQKVGDSVADMKLIEADKEGLRKICAIMNVDPILLGLKEGAKYDNQEGAYKALVTQTIMPQLNDLAEGLNNWLLPMYTKKSEGGDEVATKAYFLEADSKFYPELQPDAKLIKETYASGGFTYNEYRSELGWDAHVDPIADLMLVATNVKPTSMEIINEQQAGKEKPAANDGVTPDVKAKLLNTSDRTKAEFLKGCLMFYPDIDVNDWVNGIRKLVPSHIVEEYYFDPHLTVLYGFDDQAMETTRLAEVVGRFLSENPIAIDATRIGVFSNDMDVIKINVEDLNGNLTRLNQLLKEEFTYQNDYPVYKPHITIAYAKKGSGQYFDGALIDLSEYGLKNINSGLMKYSDSSKRKTVIGAG
ncbi:phage portal protein [Sphingobacterium corticis]|uniref:Phage portal protein n=1 Tax=Sphingobacterium corticis TaxID=1812823 RepID=A0ABW5NEA5_9SPHI